MFMFLFTLFGYVLPATLFLLGIMGLISGYMPFLTRRPIPGVQIKIAGVMLTLPLIMAVYLGFRDTDSAIKLAHLAIVQQQQQEILDQAKSQAVLVSQRLDTANENLEGISEDKVEDLVQRLEPFENAREEAARLPDMIEAARKPLTEEASESVVNVRRDLEDITERLQMYERFFDRILVSLIALLLAFFLIPETKPYPREATTTEN